MAGTVNPNYGTLAALLPNNGYQPSGGIGGIQSGIQLADYLDSMDRSYRMDDLTYKSESNKLNNELLNNPLLESERALKLSQNSEDQKIADSGLKRQDLEATLNSKLESLAQTKGNNAVQLVNNQATLAEEYLNLESSGQMTDEMRANYENNFKKNGMNLNLRGGDPNTKILLSRMALMAPAARKFSEAQNLSAQNFSQSMQRDEISNERALEQTRMQTNATKYAADAHAATQSKNPADRTLNEIEKKQVITSDDLNRVTWALEAKERVSIKNDPAMEPIRSAWRNTYANTDKKNQKNLGATMEEYVNKQEEKIVTRKTNEQLANYLSGKQIEIGGQTVTIKPGNIDSIVKKTKEADAGKNEMPKDPDPAAEKLKALNKVVSELQKEMNGMTPDEKRDYANKKLASIPNREMALDIYKQLEPYFNDLKKGYSREASGMIRGTQ